MTFSSFRDLEHTGWERVAGKYEEVWSSLTRQFIPPLLDAAGLEKGMRLLDVACGPGYVAAEASRRGATAIGLDFSTQMINHAQRLYPTITFVEGDAEELPFPAGTFDRVIMNFGLLHLSDPRKAIHEARRILPDGGLLGFTVWAEPEKNPGAKIVDDAIAAHADMSVALPEGPPYFLFCDKKICTQVLEHADFTSVTHNMVTVHWVLPTEGFLFEAEQHAGVRTAALLGLQTPERLDAIRKAIEQRVRQYKTPDGFRIPMAAYIITARAT
jgi:SAM-dependent methyltransferase